jgi:hypothetical protein
VENIVCCTSWRESSSVWIPWDEMVVDVFVRDALRSSVLGLALRSKCITVHVYIKDNTH